MKTYIQKTTLITLGLSFVSLNSLAENKPGGFFIEPALTYQVTDTEIDYPAPLANSDGSANGFGIGGLIGIHISDIIFAGADARFSMPSFKDDATGYDSKVVAYNLSPVIGIQMPNVGLRVWASYILWGDFNPAASGSFDIKFKDATGYRIGTGFRIKELSLNLEYQDIQYAKTELEAIGVFTPGTNFDNVNLKTNSWILSVSMPLAL